MLEGAAWLGSEVITSNYCQCCVLCSTYKANYCNKVDHFKWKFWVAVNANVHDFFLDASQPHMGKQRTMEIIKRQQNWGKQFNRLLLELIKNVNLSSFFRRALSEGPYQTPPSPRLFAEQCPQRSLLHSLAAARGTQDHSLGICDLLPFPGPGLSRNSPSVTP